MGRALGTAIVSWASTPGRLRRVGAWAEIACPRGEDSRRNRRAICQRRPGQRIGGPCHHGFRWLAPARLDHPRNAVDLLAAAVDAAFWVVENSVFVKNIIDCCASTRGINLAQHI